jgi:mono/diheme cytochrome c family protein
MGRRIAHGLLLLTMTALGAGPLRAQQTGGGEYLTRAGDCIACHTAPKGAPGAGGFRMPTPFGDLLTPNITPDSATGIGGWTADEFYRAMHDGVNRRGQDMYPAMPYTFYTKVTREDSDSIYAFLMSRPPVRNTVKVNQLRYPFDQRWTMMGWRELFFHEGTYAPDVSRSEQWNRGAYLVEGLGHCDACHSPMNKLGANEKRRAFTGGSVDGWFAPNLTNELGTGLGNWSVGQVATYLKTGAAKGKSTAFGDMAMVIHGSLSFLTDADLRAMAEYLKSRPPRASGPAPGTTEVVPAQAASLYLTNCAGCHQAKGRGIPGVFPPLTGNGAVVAPDPTNVIRVILQGIPAQNNYSPMPALGGSLTDQEVADISNYVRSNWGNTAPTNASAAMVAGIRKSLAP